MPETENSWRFSAEGLCRNEGIEVSKWLESLPARDGVGEIEVGAMLAAPAIFEASLVIGFPQRSTDPLLSLVLAVLLGVPAVVLLIHGVRRGKSVGWKDTRKAQRGLAKTR